MAVKTQTKQMEAEEEKIYIGEAEETTKTSENDDNNLTQFKDEVDDYYKKKKIKKTILKVGIGVLAAFVLAIGIGVIHNVTSNNGYKEGKKEIAGENFAFADNNSFTLDGVEYSFPLKASTFIENGWTIVFNHEEDKVDYLEDYESAYIVFQKDSKEFDATLKSYSGEKVAIENADVYAIYMDDNRTPDFVGPLDLSVGQDTSEAKDTIENSGYAYKYSFYSSKYSESYYYTLVDDSADYYFSYHVDCYGEEVNDISIYYNDYDYD